LKGFLWTPQSDWRITAGYLYEHFWDAACAIDSRGDVSTQGLFLRAEWRYCLATVFFIRLRISATRGGAQPSPDVSMDMRHNGEVEDLRYATTACKKTQITRLPHEPSCGLRFGELQVAQKTDRIDSRLTWYTVCGLILSSMASGSLPRSQ
jgi:hypothetical protein